MENYRPLSILPVASEILERAVQSYKPVISHQFGYSRKHHSAQDAVTSFTDHSRKEIDDGCPAETC